MMNGKWEQNFLFPGGSGTRNLSASSSPMSTLSSNYRGAGGSFTTETTTTYLSGPGMMDRREQRWEKVKVKLHNTSLSFICLSFHAGGSRRQDVIGGVHTSDVILRKRSENRGYMEENIRDSIVMGDLSSKFPDLGKFSPRFELI